MFVSNGKKMEVVDSVLRVGLTMLRPTVQETETEIVQGVEKEAILNLVLEARVKIVEEMVAKKEAFPNVLDPKMNLNSKTTKKSILQNPVMKHPNDPCYQENKQHLELKDSYQTS